jgi:hypothetical protein
MFSNVIIGKQLGMSKPRQKFLGIFFQTLFILRGKVTLTNLSRFSGWSERTFRRQYRRAWDFVKMNLSILGHVERGECIAAIDASAFKKSGKKTFGLGWFWSSIANRAIKGIEISCIALVSLKHRTAFSLSVVQTNGKTKDKSRMQTYIRQLKDCKAELVNCVKYLVADGFYSKSTFVNAVLSIGLHHIGRLRDDANMMYLFKGKHEKRKGRKNKYGGKFSGVDRRKWKFVQNLQYDKKKVEMHTALMFHKSLKRVVRVVALLTPETGKHVLLFSTDHNLAAEKILEYYSSRFQIEFIFRDAKQHLGLEDCQSRNRNALHFHFNAVMTALNLIKADLFHQGRLSADLPISVADYKTEVTNRIMIQRFTEKLGLSPEFVINHPAYEELVNFGRLVA